MQQDREKGKATIAEEKIPAPKPVTQLPTSDVPKVQVDPNASASTNCETISEGTQKNSSAEDVVMCGTTEIFGDGESDSDREPPIVTQDLSYFSEDEIVPNPKACFIPRISMQQEENERGEVTIAPCFPVSGKSRSERFTPYDRPPRSI